MSDDPVYRDFIKWAGQSWWELPESVHLLPMIKANYTPVEAAFLIGFPHKNTSLEHLAEARGLSPGELAPRLTELGRKGMIYKSKRGDSVRYRLNDTFMALLRPISGRDIPTSA